jgi:hypothetical protein
MVALRWIVQQPAGKHACVLTVRSHDLGYDEEGFNLKRRGPL